MLTHKQSNADFVMPAWIAGIQIRKDAAGNIHVNLIPAVHAGMTRSRALCSKGPKSLHPVFSTKIEDKNFSCLDSFDLQNLVFADSRAIAFVQRCPIERHTSTSNLQPHVTTRLERIT